MKGAIADAAVIPGGNVLESIPYYFSLFLGCEKQDNLTLLTPTLSDIKKVIGHAGVVGSVLETAAMDFEYSVGYEDLKRIYTVIMNIFISLEYQDEEYLKKYVIVYWETIQRFMVKVHNYDTQSLKVKYHSVYQTAVKQKIMAVSNHAMGFMFRLIKEILKRKEEKTRKLLKELRES